MELRDQPNLSAEIARRVRERILDARMHEGARINEVHLAAELGVSRTPLREALTALAAEGALDSVPRRGFFVRPLTTEELDDIYDIRPLLDPEALRLAGIPDRERLDTLDELNAKLLASGDLEEAIRNDDEWHLQLVAACPNRVLIDLIRQFMQRTRRYEMALMGNPVNVRSACATHARILQHLREGKLRSARAELKRNLQTGKIPIKAWLEDRARNLRKGRSA